MVDDSDINSVASHLFIICKNWHLPLGLYIIRLVYGPWLGRRVPGWNSPMSPRSCNISFKSTFKAESYRESYLLCASAPHPNKMRATLSGALLHNVHHASPSELGHVAAARQNLFGSSDAHIIELVVVDRLDRTCTLSATKASTSAQLLIPKPSYN